MTAAADPRRIGPAGRPILTLKRPAAPAAASPASVSAPGAPNTPGTETTHQRAPQRPAPGGPTQFDQVKPSPVALAPAPVAIEPTKADPDRVGVRACWATLRERFPAVFAGEPLPLAIGAGTELRAVLIEAGHPPAIAGRAIGRLLHGKPYLRALARWGSMRHDLAGNPREPVAAEHRNYAADELARRKKSGPKAG